MTIVAPEIDITIPPVYHRHVWRVKIRIDKFLPIDLLDMTADELDGLIYAGCDDCLAEMDKAQIEMILNGWPERTLIDE